MDTPKKSGKVTVIIPCYNREKFVGKTVDSALSQTYPNIEIIAVNDGSTDSTGEVLKSYGTRIKVLEHPGGVNKGQSAAINLAMREADGEYVAILDSDDLWHPDKLARQVKFLENNPDVGLVYANGYAIDENDDNLYELYKPGHVETNDPKKVLLNCYLAIPSCSLVRRAAFEAAGEFDETMRSAQDHDMAVRLAEVTKFAYINEHLWYYRRHSDTQSCKHSRRRWEIGFKILEKAYKRRDYGLKVKRKRLAILNFRVGQCLLEEHKFVRAVGYFIKAGLMDPARAISVLLGIESLSGQH